MIYITNRFDEKLNNEEWDYNFAIVRSISKKAPLRAGEEQVSVLSPSSELFGWYYNLKKQGLWRDDLFVTGYVPRFLKEMHSQEARDMLNKIYLLDKQGKKIALTCFCTNEAGCHRSIIAGLLQGVGCAVITSSGTDYRKYYDMYRNIKK